MYFSSYSNGANYVLRCISLKFVSAYKFKLYIFLTLVFLLMTKMNFKILEGKLIFWENSTTENNMEVF